MLKKEWDGLVSPLCSRNARPGRASLDGLFEHPLRVNWMRPMREASISYSPRFLDRLLDAGPVPPSNNATHV